MSPSKPRVLILSSVSVKIGPARIAEDYYIAYKKAGIDVDLLLPFEEHDHPEYLYIEKRPSLEYKIRWKLFYKTKPKDPENHYFFYHSENYPMMRTSKVISAIKKKYDIVLTIFWQEAFSFQTMLAIYDKLKCLMVFSAVDYSTMSGGCHFTGSCDKFKTGCGKCPVYNGSILDCTHSNVEYRKQVIEKVHPVIMPNFYMYDRFYQKSFLWKNYDRYVLSSGAIIDTTVFKPLDKEQCRKKCNIPNNKPFVILFGSQSLTDPRKGINYLIESLRLLHQKLSDTEREEVLIVALGKNFGQIQHQIQFETLDLGYQKVENLPEIYSAASCFVCPSVDDAGPMMVNQSICCGTPVVGFDMGSVKTVVKGKDTGFCAELKNSQDLADKLELMYRLPANEYKAMQQKCRKVALETSSYEAKAKAIIDIYNKYSFPI